MRTIQGDIIVVVIITYLRVKETKTNSKHCHCFFCTADHYLSPSKGDENSYRLELVKMMSS